MQYPRPANRGDSDCSFDVTCIWHHAGVLHADESWRCAAARLRARLEFVVGRVADNVDAARAIVVTARMERVIGARVRHEKQQPGGH